MSELHLHGRMCKRMTKETKQVKHVAIDTALIGQHFDTIIVHYVEGFDADSLSTWLCERGLTRLNVGGELLFEYGPVHPMYV